MKNMLFSENEKEKVYSLCFKVVETHEDRLTENMKKVKRDFSDQLFKESIKKKINNNIDKLLINKISATASDPIGDLLLELLYNHNPLNKDKNYNLYQDRVKVQMQIGSLLELYVLKKGLSNSWTIVDQIIDKVDFVWIDRSDYKFFQIKNGTSTENSSSKSNRESKGIDIWKRRNPSGKKFYWNEFPDPQLNLSEEGFMEFTKYFVELQKKFIDKLIKEIGVNHASKKLNITNKTLLQNFNN